MRPRSLGATTPGRPSKQDCFGAGPRNDGGTAASRLSDSWVHLTPGVTSGPPVTAETAA